MDGTKSRGGLRKWIPSRTECLVNRARIRFVVKVMCHYNHLKALAAAIYTAALVCMIILSCVDSAGLFFFLNSVSDICLLIT